MQRELSQRQQEQVRGYQREAAANLTSQQSQASTAQAETSFVTTKSGVSPVKVTYGFGMYKLDYSGADPNLYFSELEEIYNFARKMEDANNSR